jgi:hypothetical protein
MIFLKKYFINIYICFTNKANRNVDIFCFEIIDLIYQYENYYVVTYFINKYKNLRQLKIFILPLQPKALQHLLLL